jgi:hypothetical protein
MAALMASKDPHQEPDSHFANALARSKDAMLLPLDQWARNHAI